LTKPAFVFDETSFLPFWAILQGKQSLSKVWFSFFTFFFFLALIGNACMSISLPAPSTGTRGDLAASLRNRILCRVPSPFLAVIVKRWQHLVVMKVWFSSLKRACFLSS
jgi:hypothetical protein